MSRREEKRTRTRERLIDAAFSLFESKGYATTTMEDIAEAAEVSRRTAFRYFPTKESLVFPYRQQRLTRFEAELKRVCADPSFASRYEAVRHACLAMADAYVEDPERVRAQERIVRASRQLEGLDRLFDSTYERVVAEALSDSDSPRMEHEVEAAALVATLRAIIRRWVDEGAKDDLAAKGLQALDFLERKAFGR